jgi:hypothetical protein
LQFFFHLPFAAFEVQRLLVNCFECAFFVTPNAHPMGSDLVLYKMGWSSKMGRQAEYVCMDSIRILMSFLINWLSAGRSHHERGHSGIGA